MPEKQSGYLFALLATFVFNMEDRRSNREKHPEIRAVEKAKTILQASLKHPPAVIDLCRKVGVNKNKLQKGFRLTEGKSVAEYVRTLRMERALDLLEDDTLSIQDVAEKVGYNGISNFYAVFRQPFGDTPAAIQKLLETK